MYIKRKQEEAFDTCILSECNLVSAMVYQNPDFCLPTSVVNEKTMDCLCVHSVFALAISIYSNLGTRPSVCNSLVPRLHLVIQVCST